MISPHITDRPSESVIVTARPTTSSGLAFESCIRPPPIPLAEPKIVKRGVSEPELPPQPPTVRLTRYVAMPPLEGPLSPEISTTNSMPPICSEMCAVPLAAPPSTERSLTSVDQGARTAFDAHPPRKTSAKIRKPHASVAALRLLHAVAQVAALAVQHARMQEDVMSAMALQEADSLKSALLAAVTHELRAPLGTILTAVTGLLDEAKRWTGTERRDLLAAIQEETEGLTTFVNDVLDLSRIEGGALRQQRDWYNLREFLETVVDRRSAIAATHHVIVETSDDATEGYFDYAQLVQVVGNVLDNAAKFSPIGTVIALRGSRSASDLTVMVQDRGIGVAPDEATRIFERFYRGAYVTDRVPGSGLGLAICKGIVEAHGGVIEVQPSADGGSIFSISIPQPPRVDGSEDDGA